MHIVESEESSHQSQREVSFEDISNRVIEIISKDLDIEIDRDGFNYYRFETHLKYLLQRLDDQPLKSENVEMFSVMKDKYPNVYATTKDVCDYLKTYTGMNIEEEEMLYLMLHINRLTDRNN